MGNVTLLSVPLEKHALKRARYIIYRFPFHTNEVSIHQTEGVFPHMHHAFEQDKYASVYKILLSTPVCTPLAQHDFRTDKMYMNSFNSVVLQNTLYKEGIIIYGDTVLIVLAL